MNIIKDFVLILEQMNGIKDFVLILEQINGIKDFVLILEQINEIKDFVLIMEQMNKVHIKLRNFILIFFKFLRIIKLFFKHHIFSIYFYKISNYIRNVPI